MKYLKLNSLSLYLCLFVSLFSCRKEVSTPLAPEPVTNLQYAISDGRVNLTWQPSGNGYDAFQLELSRMADFSVINENIEVNGNVNQHSFWRLPLGEVYHVRVRAASALNGLFSDWATLSFETVENNILYSIAEDKVTANSVMFNWSNPDDGNNNQSGKITHIELRPFKGAVIRHNLLAQDLSARQTSVSSLAANMQYVATIYNDRFPLGTQTFATHAQPEGNTWKLEPYSDLVYAIKAAKNNDILLLNEGIYNYATVEIPIDNKIITIKAAEGVNARPRLYTRLLSLQG
ncbi:MAG TPA: fibronectin type III domain-containing protein, partial [Niabella sp.]|nr:fibronectin type III domain-containing protein [Niabella sp.]